MALLSISNHASAELTDKSWGKCPSIRFSREHMFVAQGPVQGTFSFQTVADLFPIQSTRSMVTVLSTFPVTLTP